MLQNLILINSLSSAFWKKKKKENGPRGFFPGQDTPSWLSCVGFLQLLGAIKG
jgi:hypothetical protein